MMREDAPSDMDKRSPHSLVVWLRLMRLPGALTAARDVVAGAAVAGAPLTPVTALVAFGSVLLYGAGMILNDVLDFKKDQQYHPERPLPSKHITRRAAMLVGVSFLTLGALTGFLIGGVFLGVTLSLALSILLYDSRPGDVWILGPLLMGACRGLNFARGLTISTEELQPIHLYAAGAFGFMIAGLTLISLLEEQKLPIRMKSTAVLAILIGTITPAAYAIPDHPLRTALLALSGVALAAYVTEPVVRRQLPSLSVRRGVFSLPSYAVLYGVATERADAVLIGILILLAVYASRRALAFYAS